MGHGIELRHAAGRELDLVAGLAREVGTCFKICPSVYLVTHSVGDMGEIVSLLRRLVELRLPWCIGTDNPYLIQTNLRKEYGIIGEGFGADSHLLKLSYEHAKAHTFLKRRRRPRPAHSEMYCTGASVSVINRGRYYEVLQPGFPCQAVPARRRLLMLLAATTAGASEKTLSSFWARSESPATRGIRGMSETGRRPDRRSSISSTRHSRVPPRTRTLAPPRPVRAATMIRETPATPAGSGMAATSRNRASPRKPGRHPGQRPPERHHQLFDGPIQYNGQVFPFVGVALSADDLMLSSVTTDMGGLVSRRNMIMHDAAQLYGASNHLQRGSHGRQHSRQLVGVLPRAL